MPGFVRPTEFQDPWFATMQQYLDDVEAALAAVPFALPGPLLETTSPSVPVLTSFTVNNITVALGTAGTDPTIIQFRHNGAVAAEVTVEAGETAGAATFGPLTLDPGDTYALSVAYAGPGATDLGGSLGFVA